MQDHKLFSKKVDANVREAIWQWLIDHSKVEDTGFLNIRFYLKDQDDFWKRVHYRYTGQFERYNKIERESRLTWTYMKTQQRGAQEFGDQIKKIEEGNNYYYKILVWLYRKSRNKIKKYGRDNTSNHIITDGKSFTSTD